MALGQELPFLSSEWSFTHSHSLRRLHCSSRSPGAALAAQTSQGWRKAGASEPACLIPSLCPDPTWPWLPLERQMLTNQAITLTHTQVCPAVPG